MKKKFLAFLILLIVAWVAYPYWCLNRFDKAVAERDKSAIEQLVDFPALQTHMAEQYREQVAGDFIRKLESSGMPGAANGIEILDASIKEAVGKILTADGFIAFSKLAVMDNDERYTWRFFTNPIEFKAETNKGGKVFLKFTGGVWKISRVEWPVVNFGTDRLQFEAGFNANPAWRRLLNAAPPR